MATLDKVYEESEQKNMTIGYERIYHDFNEKV